MLCPHEDRLDAAIDADAVLEVHDVVAGLERERVDAAADVAARAAHAPLAAEDLVVGEHAHAALVVAGRQDEAAAERADDERRRRRIRARPR